MKETAGEHTVPALEATAEPRALFEHSRTPITMRNFLLRVMPGTADQVLGLKSWQSSLLTRQLLDLYRSMDLPELTEDELASRCALIERWTGLYGLAQDIDEITERSVQPRKTIHNRIDRVMLLVATRLSDNKRTALLRRAAATPKPGQDI